LNGTLPTCSGQLRQDAAPGGKRSREPRDLRVDEWRRRQELAGVANAGLEEFVAVLHLRVAGDTDDARQAAERAAAGRLLARRVQREEGAGDPPHAGDASRVGRGQADDCVVGCFERGAEIEAGWA
jgi:hypothetical protein